MFEPPFGPYIVGWYQGPRLPAPPATPLDFELLEFELGLYGVLHSLAEFRFGLSTFLGFGPSRLFYFRLFVG